VSREEGRCVVDGVRVSLDVAVLRDGSGTGVLEEEIGFDQRRSGRAQDEQIHQSGTVSADAEFGNTNDSAKRWHLQHRHYNGGA
jgi:hypothetical protein